MALSSTDPKVLMGQAKCFSCLSPKLQYQLRTYLLAKIAMGDTSITGVEALSVASTCFSCFTHGELLAAKQYLMAVWLGLDTTKTGIIAQAATAACDYACLTPVQADQVQTYLLAVTAGVATDAAGVRALELAAKCFECPTNKRQLEMQVYLLSTLAPGAPTTASAIMQAAGCFLACVPAELHAALSTSLFTQVAGRSTPPCVTPSAPSSVQATTARVADPTTQLLVRWLQPANSGTLVTGYTVFWGTTAGGPYTNNSGLIAGGTKQYTITGLTAGTTYYIVVQADTSISGCVSSNSAETNATTSGSSPLDPAVTDWQARVVANGGASPGAATLAAVDTFWKGVKADGLDTLIVALNFIAPDNLIAAQTPLIVGSAFGGLDPWTNVNNKFVAGDLSVNGLTGNGVDKVLRTGIDASLAFIPGSAGWSCYGYTVNNTGYDIGMITLATILLGGMNHGGTSRSYIGNGSLANAVTVATKGNGFYTGNRISTTDHRMFFATSVSPFAQIGATDAVLWNSNYGNPGIAAFGDNNSSVGLENLSSNTISFFALHAGLTSVQAQNLYNRVQTLRQAFGGGFR